MNRSRFSLATLALAGCALTGGVACSTAESASSPATAAASDSTSDSTTGATTGATNPSAAAPNAAAPAALQFSAPLVGGGTMDFTQFAGQTVALWFWAPT